jgi:hypothetical protein
MEISYVRGSGVVSKAALIFASTFRAFLPEKKYGAQP